MSEYTKEQEVEAMDRGERLTWGPQDVAILLAMAKRTAEAEKRADATEETNRNNLRVSSDLLDSKSKQMERMDQDLQSARRERDALRAKVAELKEQLHEKCGRIGGCLKVICGSDTRCKCDEAKAAPPPVVVTREMVEALRDFAEVWAYWETPLNGGDGPMNDAARLVVAWRKALEVKP